MIRGWMPPHPTFFVRRSVYENHGVYRLDMGTAADYEFLLRALLVNRIRVLYIPTLITVMRMGVRAIQVSKLAGAQIEWTERLGLSMVFNRSRGRSWQSRSENPLSTFSTRYRVSHG